MRVQRLFYITGTLIVLYLACTCSAKSFSVHKNSAAPPVTLTVEHDTSYTITVNGELWYQSVPIEMHANNQIYSVADGASNPLSVHDMKEESGLQNSTFGTFDRVSAKLEAADSFTFGVAWEVFHDTPMIVFETAFPKGAEGTSLKNPFATISSFPAFSAGSDGGNFSSLQYLTYQKLWDNGTRGVGLDGYIGGLEGGMPFVQWSGEEELPTIVSVLSPLDSFPVGYLVPRYEGGVFRQGDQTTLPSPTELRCGLTGMIEEVPEGFVHRYVMYFGTGGVTDAMKGWGDTLLAASGKDTERIHDFSRDFLGYWTDNGAYYYYKTLDEDPDANYEDTMIAIADYHDSEGLPVRYYQLDSWWYYKNSEGDGNCTLFHCGGGVTNWDARPDVFPDGMKAVRQKMGKPLVLHNRYWATDNVYLDDYDFIVDRVESLPNDPDFFPDLLRQAAEWGVITYEQDWLVRQYSAMRATQTSVNQTRSWLLEMGAAAQERGMTIQNCMPLPQILLQSTEIQHVTQTRVSDDYLHGHNQWNIGKTSLMAWSLGLAPFKDNFWSASVQPNNTYNAVEDNPRMEAIISALSAGPLAFGDRLGFANNTLLLGTCMHSGELLRPSKPATPIERYFGNNPPNGELWSTLTTVPGGGSYGELLAISVQDQYTVVPQDMNLTASPGVMAGEYVAWEYDDVNFASLVPFTDSGIVVGGTPAGTVNGKQYWQLWHVSPVLSSGWVVLGETGKIVHVAKNRVIEITVGSTNTDIMIQGGAGESVDMNLYDSNSGTVVRQTCSISNAGTSLLSCSNHSTPPVCTCEQ